MRYITEPVVEKAPLALAKQDVPVVAVLPVMFGTRICQAASGLSDVPGTVAGFDNEATKPA